MVHIIHSTLYTLLYLFIIVPKSFQEDSDYSEDNSLIKENGILKVYVCGCCINNGKNTARAGVAVWFNHKHPYNVFKPVSGRATNINAELEASILGIETALKHGFEEVTIHTDSEFVVKCATSWLKRWKENGWKTKNGDDVKNQITLKNLDESINCMKNVFWVHDKASDTEMGYKEAFSLAQKGAKVYALQNNIPEWIN
ncbi:ribonuclease H1-like isoform X2 [Lycorma delicatula]|uniref:ribonuclease H1-like isoform X2 n=1 Tax=Lycorma delicatula TaxID=130591 RepID=UPI003F517BE1